MSECVSECVSERLMSFGHRSARELTMKRGEAEKGTVWEGRLGEKWGGGGE